jgi:hypothetical protein
MTERTPLDSSQLTPVEQREVPPVGGFSDPERWVEEHGRILRSLVGILSPSCKQAARLQSEAMDRRLSLFERFGLQVHLLLCKWCRRYGEQLTFLRSAALECDEHENPVVLQRLSPDARERIKKRLLSTPW